MVYVNTEATSLWDCFFWLQGCCGVCAKGERLVLLQHYPLHPKSSAAPKDRARRVMILSSLLRYYLTRAAARSEHRELERWSAKEAAARTEHRKAAALPAPTQGQLTLETGMKLPCKAGCIQTKETLQGWLLHGDTSGACAQISLNKLLLGLKWLFLVVVLYKYIKAGFPGVCLQSFYTELLRQYNAHFSLPAALNCLQLSYHELPAALYIQHSQQSNKMTFVFMLCLWHLTE